MRLPPIKRFWNVLKTYRAEIRLIYIYAIFVGIVNLTLPLGIQAIVNFLQTGELTTTWFILVCFVMLGIAVTGFLQVLQLRVVENIQQDLFARSAFEFAYRIPQISFLQLDKIHAPELANRFFDTLTIQKGLPKILIDFSLAIFQIVFGLLLLAVYSPYFIILGMILSFILWGIFQYTGPRGLQTSLNESKYKYRMAHWLEEVARLNRTFKLNSESSFHLEKADAVAVDYLTAREKHFKILVNQFRIFIGFKVILAAGLLLLGGFLVFGDQMNIGQFVAAEIIIILIINSVEKVIRIIDTIYDVLTALEKIGYVTDLQLDEHSGRLNTLGESATAVRAKHISFGFPEGPTLIFDDISFSIQDQEHIVLVGESGSGKSLLLQIMAGIHVVNKGKMLIYGSPIGQYRPELLHSTLGVALPVNQIFEGSFRENILMGRDIPERRLLNVLDVLKLDAYLSTRSEGINDFVDSGGRSLPRSIIQKLLIARIIIHQPRLLLMEDPLQFIADEEKRRIIDYLMHEDQNWTIVVVSDFPYWKEKCARIIDLTHDNLKQHAEHLSQ